MIRDVPSWAYDIYSREGRAAFQVFLQGSNLTEEGPTNYVQWPDAHLNWNQFERVITTGVRAKF